MFRPDDILARMREKPFRPVRIIVSEGQKYDIRHPDLVFVGSRDIMIGFPAADNPHVYDQVTRVALVHIVSTEDLPAPAASPNGEG